jgi:hypothetical protein
VDAQTPVRPAPSRTPTPTPTPTTTPGPGRSPEVDAAWSAFTARWDGARVVDAQQAGARGDGRVAIDCAITAGSFTLDCAKDYFSPSDTDKAIVVYGAGAAWNGLGRPLSTTIRRVTSARSVVLAAEATRRAAPSSRVVWGTDDTAALQRAVDSLAAKSINNGPGGVLSLPSGHYLVRELSLPCARVGTFLQGACGATYNRIWIRGAGRDRTVLENWDVETAAPGVITLGRRADVPGADASNVRLTTIAISDLEVRQVAHATRAVNTIWSSATEDVWIVNTRGAGHSYECYVMAGGVKSVRWRVHYNEMGPCGHGGPAYGGSTSALNLNGSDWVASHNLVTESLQAVEMGSRRGMLVDNVFVAPHLKTIGVNIGSTGSGIRGNTVARNRILGFVSAVGATNSIGTVTGTSILDNEILNGVIEILNGLEVNSVVDATNDPVAHGTSVIRGNRITFDIDINNTPIKIGTADYARRGGLEHVIVSGNTVRYTRMHIDAGPSAGRPCVSGTKVEGGTCRLSGGFLALLDYGQVWRAGTAYAVGDHVAPAVPNGRYYVSVKAGTSGATSPPFPAADRETVQDGTVVWRNAGPRPKVVATDNVLRGPAGAVSSGFDIALYGTTPKDALQVERLDVNFEWETCGPPPLP